MNDYIIGIDVGTGSVRAAVFNSLGEMLTLSVVPIASWNPRPEYVEQSSENIWNSAAIAVKNCLNQAKLLPDQIRGISFDATCSLVVLDENFNPLPVDIEGDPNRNIIVWMDHRAIQEAEQISAGGYEVLRYVGDKLSPEMEMPKLLWIKRHLPETWNKALYFFDLADFMTFRATGSQSRSLCTTVCKWTYLGHESRWDQKFLQDIGLEELPGKKQIGTEILPQGTPIGSLSAQAAIDLGLTVSCKVGMGIIDAHAGGIGLLGSVWEPDEHPDARKLESALAFIGGTSNCLMALAAEPRFITGLWGPYFSAMIPGLWLTEGGQTTAGSAIDYMIASHPNSPALHEEAKEKDVTVYQLLNQELTRLSKDAGLDLPDRLTGNIHILPYFLGNRSPNADPYARAAVDGLVLDYTITTQTLLYLSTIQAVAYGTRDVIRALNEHGYKIEQILVTGGGCKNPVWLQQHANAIGMPLILPREPEAVLLGTAMLAAVGSGIYENLPAAMQKMAGRGDVIYPQPGTEEFHTAKFNIFREQYQQHLKRREIMKDV